MNLNTFDLNLLRIFEAVHRDRSVSRAADSLGLSQPAVSNALGRLRQKVGDPLFVRGPTGMIATTRAAQLAAAVNEALTVIRHGLNSNPVFDPTRSDRRFELLMTDIGELLFLPSLLKELGRTAPGIDIGVRETRLRDYDDLLTSGSADLAIGRIQLSERLCGEAVHSSEFVALLRRDSRYLQWGEDGTPSIDYATYLLAPQVLVRQPGMARNPIQDALGADARQIRIALTIPHVGALSIIMAQSNLVATVPAAVASHLELSGDLCAVSLPFAVEPISVYQWWHRRNQGDAGHAWLRGVIRETGRHASRSAKLHAV